MSNSKKWVIIIFSMLMIFTLILFALNIVIGSVSIPMNASFDIITGTGNQQLVWRNIIIESRLPQALAAVFSGAALAISGLILQTYFRNPLAEPSVLGISSGASMGVAALILIPGFVTSTIDSSMFAIQNISIIIAAMAGSALVLLLILSLTTQIRDTAMLLVAGIMISALASSFIGIMRVFSRSESVHSFAIWGMGSFGMVTQKHLAYFIPMIVVGLIASLFLAKSLNTLQLGEKMAQHLGLNVKRARISIILISGLLTAVVTAYCGPIAFIGIAIPHITKLILRSSNHALLIPAVMINGAMCALICNLIAKLPGLDDTIPINAITALFGAPVVIWIILRRNHKSSAV
ncbi:MAG: iron ABC transporter permease [Bacteroidota bacterium]